MKWSLSEYLNLIELRSQTWCRLTMAQGSGFTIPGSEHFFLYGVESGSVRLAGMPGGVVELHTGDLVVVLGEAHGVRTLGASGGQSFPFLAEGEYVDAPVDLEMGAGLPAARLICSRLLVRWPGGHAPRTSPALLHLKAAGLVDFAAFAVEAHGPGASAVLTRLANLLFVEAFRRHPDCQAVFRESNLQDPISRAVQYIETHPFREWSVESLARKVGMGRANFAARFAASVGKTPFEALTEERMKHAAEFVCATDLKIAEISSRVGYRSEAAFSRRFAARFGISPGAMRTQSRA
jgi:AraC-like DNA-binding protein